MNKHGFGAVILAAGVASRLGSIAQQIPKAMLPFGGTPFLSLISRKLVRDNCTEIVVVVGHLSEIIEKHVEILSHDGMPISAIRQEGAGTGAALLTGASHLRSRQPFFGINADTILDVNFSSVVEFHLNKCADVTAIVTALANVPNQGAIAISEGSRIVNFDEGGRVQLRQRHPALKARVRRSNCGHYCFDRFALNRIAAKPVLSLELDIMPTMVERGRAYAFDNGLRLFHDFGTVDRFREAQKMTDQVIDIYTREL